VTGNSGVLTGEHFSRMKDGAIVANSGHFNVEIDVQCWRRTAKGGPSALSSTSTSSPTATASPCSAKAA